MIVQITKFNGFVCEQSSTTLVNTPKRSPGTERVFYLSQYYLSYEAVNTKNTEQNNKIILEIDIKKLFPDFKRITKKRLLYINSTVQKINNLILNTNIEIEKSKKLIRITRLPNFEINDRLEINIWEPIDKWYINIIPKI